MMFSMVKYFGRAREKKKGAGQMAGWRVDEEISWRCSAVDEVMRDGEMHEEVSKERGVKMEDIRQDEYVLSEERRYKTTMLKDQLQGLNDTTIQITLTQDQLEINQSKQSNNEQECGST